MSLFTKETGNLVKSTEIKLWQERVGNTIKWHKSYWNGYDSWTAAYLLDRAIHWGESKNIASRSQEMNDEITIPIIAVHVRNLMPFLFNRDPKFFGSPLGEKSDAAIENARAQIAYLNSIWREQNMTVPCRQTILDAAIIGHGIAEVGWGIEADIPKTDDELKKGNINFQEYISEENPYVRRINPFMFIRDIYAPDNNLDTARWCCKFMLMTIQDLIDNDLYDEKLRKQIFDGSVAVKRVKEFRREFKLDEDSDEPLFAPEGEKDELFKGPDDLVLLYKVFDRKFGNVFTLIPGYEEKVLRLDPFKDLYGHLKAFPFEEVNFEEIPNEPYGYGPARYLADIQYQTNRNRTKIFAISRACNPAYIYSGPDKMDSTEANKLKGDQPLVVINIPAGGKLEPKPLPEISADVYKAAQLLKQDYTDISGEDILLRGGQLSSRTSAEEVRQIGQLRGLRLETNIDNTHTFVHNVGKQVLANAKAYLTKSKVVEALGVGLGEDWIKVSPDNIKKGELNLKLGVINKPEESPDVKRRHLIEFLNMLTNPNIYQLAQLQGVQINLNALFSALLETFDIAELNNVFPGIDNRLPNIELVNQGNQPTQPNSPESTRNIQEDNVSPNSELQGIEGILNNLRGGG